MKKTFSIFVLSVFILTFFAQGHLYSELTTELKTKLETLNQKLNALWIKQDVVRIGEFLADDVILMQNYAPMVTGKASFKASMLAARDTLRCAVRSYDTSTTKAWTAGDQIIEVGNYKIKFVFEKLGPELRCDEGSYMTVWEKGRDGSMKIKSAIWNSSTAPSVK